MVTPSVRKLFESLPVVKRIGTYDRSAWSKLYMKYIALRASVCVIEFHELLSMIMRHYFRTEIFGGNC